jgi:hypothetical protein
MATTLADVETWSTDIWRSWLTRVVAGDALPPLSIHKDSTVVDALLELYRLLRSGTAKINFATAVGQVLESTPPLVENSSELHALLSICIVLRPYAAKSIARRFVFEGPLRHLTDGTQSLHQLAILTASRFEIDDELLQYVVRLLRSTRNIAEAFIAFRIIATHDRLLAVELLCSFILRVPEAIDPAAYLIVGYSSRYGYRPLFEWYTSSDNGNTDLRTLFAKLLATANILLNPVTIDSDFDRVLLSGVVAADARLLAADEVLAVARAASVDFAAAAKAIHYIWNRPTHRSEIRFVSGDDVPRNAIRDAVAESLLMIRDTTATFSPRVEARVEQLLLQFSSDVPPLPESAFEGAGYGDPPYEM